MLFLETTGVRYTDMARAMQHYIEGSLMYPFIFDRKDNFDNYSVAVVLSGDQIKKAKKIGLRVNVREDRYDGLPYIQVKSGRQPDLFDENGEPYDGNKMISNGSKGTVRLTQRPYDNQYGKGVTTFLDAVKLTDVIPYEPEEGGKSTEF